MDRLHVPPRLEKLKGKRRGMRYVRALLRLLFHRFSPEETLNRISSFFENMIKDSLKACYDYVRRKDVYAHLATSSEILVGR